MVWSPSQTGDDLLTIGDHGCALGYRLRSAENGTHMANRFVVMVVDIR